MIEEFHIENKKVELYCTNKDKEILPVIVLNCFGEEAERIFKECIKLKCKSFSKHRMENC